MSHRRRTETSTTPLRSLRTRTVISYFVITDPQTLSRTVERGCSLWEVTEIRSTNELHTHTYS
jgi:hypothetical protein